VNERLKLLQKAAATLRPPTCWPLPAITIPRSRGPITPHSFSASFYSMPLVSPTPAIER